MRTRHLIIEAYLHVLAFAMLGMGAISLLGYLQLDQPTRHNVILLPDSAVMSMLMGGLILATLRQTMGILKLLVGLLLMLTLYSLLHNQLAGGEDIGRSWLTGFLRMRSLLALIMLVATAAICMSFGPPLARRGAQLIGGLIMLLAVMSQLADILPELPMLSLGFKYDATHVANLFTLCLGFTIILLGLLRHEERTLLDQRTLVAGLLATLLACTSWYLLSRQAIQTINRESQLLLAKMQSVSANDLEQHLALLQRMAERWQSLGKQPPSGFWQQDARNSLRDYPSLELLAVLNQDFSSLELEARTPEQTTWLQHFLVDSEQLTWLQQTRSATRPQISLTRQYAQGSTRNALLGMPLRLAGQTPKLLVASLNVPAQLNRLLTSELHGFVVQVYEGDSLLYNSENLAARNTLLNQVSQLSVQLPYGQTWHLNAAIDNPQVLHAAKRLATLTLLFGLALSFFLMLSQRLAWLATQHAQQLQSANQDLEESLELQQRAHKLNQRIMQFTLDVLCSIDKQGCFHEISPSCAKLFGYPAHALLDRPFIELVLAEDRPRTREEISASMQAHTNQGFRNRCRHRDGRVIHVLWSVDWSEQEQTLFAVAHDITQLVRNEAYVEIQREILSMISHDRPLAETLEALCLMVETQQPGALCSVLLFDASGTHLQTGAAPSLPPAYNQAIDGLSIGPNVGSCGSAAFNRQLVISEDIANDPLWQDHRALALSHGLRACWSFPLIAHDGQGLGTFDIYCRHPHIPDDEQIQHLATASQLAALAIARSADRRHMEESQQRFRSLFTFNPDPVFSFDLNGHFLSINAAGLQLLGWGEEEIIGKHFTQLITESQQARIREHFASVCSGTPQRYEVRLQGKLQQALTLDVSMLPIMVDAQIVGVFGIAKDVSEHQRITSELHKALIRAQNLTRQLRGLSRAAIVTGKLRDSQELIDYLATQVRESVAAHQCGIHLCASNGAANLDGVSLSDKYADWRSQTLPTEGSPIYALVCACNQPLLLSQDELQAHPRWPDFQQHAASHPPLRGWLAVPLLDKHGVNLGILHLSDKYQGEFEMADLALAQQFAQMAASVLEGNRLLNAVLAGEQQLKAQLDFTATVTDSMAEGLLAIDTAGTLNFINPAAHALMGASAEPLLGRRLEQLLPISPNTWLPPRPSDEGQRGEFCLLAGGPRTLLYEAHPMFAGDRHSGWVIALRDVSAQRRADQAQRERDQFFNLSLEMLCMINLQGDFIQVNPAFAQTLHYAAGALIGQPYRQLIHQEDLAQIEVAVLQLQDGDPIKDLQIRAWDAEGNLHWLQFSAALGEDQLIYCAARNITEQRANAEQIQQSNLLLSMAGSSAKLGGWALELPEQRMTWSSEVCSLLDYPPGMVPALDESLALYPTEARPLIQEAVRGCVEDGVGFDLELPIHTRNGRLIDARITAQPVHDPRAGITRMIGAIQDISEHKQALREAQRLSERLRTTLESISDAFYTLDPKWHFTYVNPAAERLIQARALDLLGRDLWSAFPGSYTSEIGQHYRQALESGQSSHFESFYEPLERWFELHVYPSEEGLAVYFQDISERQQTQQELQTTLLELERSNQELQEFAFVASHDLQEPLRKIQAFSERLSTHAPDLDDEGRDYLQRMSGAAARMQALIIDLLNYSRVSSRGQPLQRIELSELLGEVLVDLETVLEHTQAKIESSPLPPVLGDANQLRQVLQNLLSNALKFQAPNNQPAVRFTVEQQDSSGWTLCIADNGIGFEEKYLDRIFNPFQRLHSREAYAGSGIGLAIVKKIVERHGARISASSQIGQGSTFRIRFPYLAKEAQ